MKQLLLEFARRGLIACGLGPVGLAVLYLVLQHQAGLEMLTVHEVCQGIFSLTALAFVAGGMNVVYQMERLPLIGAITIHGGVLYVSYLATYLVNDWLEWGTMPVLVFTAVFVGGYLVIWAVIYTVTKRNTDSVNALLKDRQQIH